MRSLCTLLAAALLAGCVALQPGPPPLTEAEIVALARAGETPAAIIRRLEETGTVLALSGSDIVRLHEAGVPKEVLDYLQRAQIEAVRRREALARMPPWPYYASPWHCWPYGPYPYSPFWRYSPFWPC